jgi:hypothetical protein
MKLELSEQDRTTLNQWVKSRAVGEKQRLRSRIVLMTADRIPSQAIIETLKISAPTLNLLRRRFVDCGYRRFEKRQDEAFASAVVAGGEGAGSVPPVSG